MAIVFYITLSHLELRYCKLVSVDAAVLAIHRGENVNTLFSAESMAICTFCLNERSIADMWDRSSFRVEYEPLIWTELFYAWSTA